MAKQDIKERSGRTDPLMASNSGGGPPPLSGALPKALETDSPGKPASIVTAMIPGADKTSARPASTQSAGSPTGLNPQSALQMLREKRSNYA